MGCAQSAGVDDEAKARNDEIESQLKRDKMNAKNEIKMLLLGAGESGKSTVLKQMKLIHHSGWNDQERESYKEIIFSNTIQSMRAILEAMPVLDIALAPQNDARRAVVMSLPGQIEADSLPRDVSDAVRGLWNDNGVREAVRRSREFQLNDSATYEYDQMLYEDESVNRMQEALTLFDSICNSRWFVKTSIILFLNKIDLFADKLRYSPMGDYFPDYNGGDDYDSACDYLLHRFVSLNQNAGSKQIYAHYTCATDTQQIKCPGICQQRAKFRTSAVRRDVFFVAFPALKAGLLDISRITLIILPFVYRLRSHLAEEGPLILPPEDPRVKQVLRVTERLLTGLGDTLGSQHIVSSANWPSTLSSSFFELFFHDDQENFYQRRDLRHDIKKPEDYSPSAVAESRQLPYRLESSNPMKIFAEEDWKVYVIDLPKINAFALPTREIFVYTGLIDLLDDDALLSGVIAHEMAHVTQRHAVENAGFLNLAAIAFDCLRGISFAFTMSFPLVTDAAASVLNMIHDTVAEKAYSRKLEMEADSVGLLYLSRAGYNPHALLDLWEIMAVVEESAAAAGQPISITDRVPFLKTHPTSLQRQRNIDALLPAAMKIYSETSNSRK
ncbi:guanine nucleotide-binding protein subunit alpha [Tulasnella sp. 332]|nr:guanine nucleotide-binding protein subunit alpha [Tulasnella sp. 332]